jgi:hypothetical protein
MNSAVATTQGKYLFTVEVIVSGIVRSACGAGWDDIDVLAEST